MTELFLGTGVYLETIFNQICDQTFFVLTESIKKSNYDLEAMVNKNQSNEKSTKPNDNNNAWLLYSLFPCSTNMPKSLYNHYYPQQNNIFNQKPSQPPGGIQAVQPQRRSKFSILTISTTVYSRVPYTVG